jgi:hypothetical protein
MRQLMPSFQIILIQKEACDADFPQIIKIRRWAAAFNRQAFCLKARLPSEKKTDSPIMRFD